ncbi:MAG: alanine racemase [Clostridia bacterium]|nr:alanine racemase [Clostridia bacterium]
MKDNFFRRTWAEIDLSAIRHNYRSLRDKVDANSNIIAVVKADAYGHGVSKVASALKDEGANFFAVSCLAEAEELRALNIDCPILILGYTPCEFAKDLYKKGFIQTVYSKDYAEELSAFATKNGVKVLAHVKLDTGMGRLGFDISSPDFEKDVYSVCNLDGLDVKGVFTHFPSADFDGDEDGEYSAKQFESFVNAVNKVEALGFKFETKHCCNSAGSLTVKGAHLDAVREGILLYGLYPSKETRHLVSVKPAMSVKTVVSMVKELKKGQSVSYGRTFVAEKDMKIATVCIGYADGYPRSLSKGGYMLINGQKAPIVGRICMDQLMLDVTEIENVKRGSIATVFGEDNGAFLPVDEIASLCNTINYEIVCLVGKRVPRVYLKDGEIIGVTKYEGKE